LVDLRKGEHERGRTRNFAVRPQKYLLQKGYIVRGVEGRKARNNHKTFYISSKTGGEKEEGSE